MKRISDQNMFLWIVWLTVFGILFFIGDSQYYMTHSVQSLLIIFIISLVVVSIFCVLSKRGQFK